MKEFIRQQLIRLGEAISHPIYIIHDNAGMFNVDYPAYNLTSARTSLEAPDMNSIAERFIRTVRREALDNFLITDRNQIRRILSEYVIHYNSQRPHQGIEQQIPIPSEIKSSGAICKSPVLGGLHHHYYRAAA